MSFFSFKKKPTLSFVFDIRDASVTLAAVKFEKSEKPEIIFCQNFQIPIQDPQDHRAYLASMLATLDSAILSVRKTLVRTGNTEKIEKHFFFFGSPWSVSQAKMIKVTKDRAFEINNAFLEKIVADEETEAEKMIGQKGDETDWRVLEEKIIRSKLNGYEVENIFGKKTADFETELFVSFIPYGIKNKIYSLVDGKISRGTWKRAGASMLASYDFLNNAYPKKNNFIGVDIGSFVTDIYVVRDGVISATGSFPSGERDILQSAAQKTSEHIVSSGIRIHRAGTYDESAKNDLKKDIGAGIQAWLSAFRESLGKISTQFDIPKDIFVLPKSELASFIVSEIAAQKDALKILEIEINMQMADEQLMNTEVGNGKAFGNEPTLKMNIIFLAKTLG